MSITFKDSNDCFLLGRIDGGKYHNKSIYINTGNTDDFIKMDNPFVLLDDVWFRNKKSDLKTTDLIRLQKAIARGKSPDDVELEDIYNEAMNYLNDKSKKELILVDGKIKPTLGKDPTITAYVAGPSGSGKSTVGKNLIVEIKRRRHKPKIYLFSQLNEDEVLDKIVDHRILIGENLIDSPITLNELKDSILIFDDIETIPNEKLKKIVSNLRDQALSEGRHHNICTICTNHMVTDYKKTKNMIAEAKLIYLFPSQGQLNSIVHLLKDIVGLNKDEINKIVNLPSRWICIHNRNPLCCIYEHGIFLLGQLSKTQNKLPTYITKKSNKMRDKERKYHNKEDILYTSDSDSESDSDSD
jgi:hypothetical protein